MGGTVDDRNRSGDVPVRVLLAVHGHEPAEWAIRACRLVSEWRDARVRVLALVDVTCPPFTSLISPARRLYAAARSAWINDEERRTEEAVDRVLRALSRPVEVVRDRSSAEGRARTIVRHAMTWAADVVVVATPISMTQWWVWPRPVQQDVPREVACAVLAIPPATVPRSTGRRFSLPRTVASKCRWAPADPAV